MLWRTTLARVFLVSAAATAQLLVGCQSTSSATDRSGMVQAVPRWKIPENWRRLRRDMSEAEVTAVLGSPDRKEFGRWRTYWRYGKTSGGPQVMFSVDTKKVDAWEGPKN